MSAKTFFVNNGQLNMGPFEMSTIASMVDRLEIKATDYLCVDVEKDEWVMICQHPEFIAFIAQSSNRPSMKPAPALALTAMPLPTMAATPSDDLTQAQWYVLKGKNRFGPFMYVDVIRMLQEKSVFEFDFVWAQGLEAWKRIAEVEVFGTDNIRGLLGDSKTNSTIFFRRLYPRSKYECEIIVHDNSQVWKGKAVELSEGGAGVVIENAMILPGQNIYLHFKPGAISKPFNVLSEVVSKRYVKGIRDNETPVVYGIKFINIQKADREAIRTNIAA